MTKIYLLRYNTIKDEGAVNLFDIEFYEDKNGKSEVFMKQTQKTPKSEIEKAKRLLEDYKNRSE